MLWTWGLAKKLLSQLTGSNIARSNKDADTYEYGHGQFEVEWITYYLFNRDVLGVEYDSTANIGLEIYKDLAESSGAHFFLDDCAIIINRPAVVKLNDDGLMHSEDSPAIMYRDNSTRIYAINGHVIAGWIIEHPELITIDKIDTENNAEVRRIMIEILFLNHYIFDDEPLLF